MKSTKIYGVKVYPLVWGDIREGYFIHRDPSNGQIRAFSGLFDYTRELDGRDNSTGTHSFSFAVKNSTAARRQLSICNQKLSIYFLKCERDDFKPFTPPNPPITPPPCIDPWPTDDKVEVNDKVVLPTPEIIYASDEKVVVDDKVDVIRVLEIQGNSIKLHTPAFYDIFRAKYYVSTLKSETPSGLKEKKTYMIVDVLAVGEEEEIRTVSLKWTE